MPPDLGFRHAGIMLQIECGNAVAVTAAADAAETHDSADVGAPLREQLALARDVEIGFLDADRHAGHGEYRSPQASFTSPRRGEVGLRSNPGEVPQLHR